MSIFVEAQEARRQGLIARVGITEASRELVAELQQDVQLWSDQAAEAGDNQYYRVAAEAKRDTLQRIVALLPKRLGAIEREAAESDDYEHGGRR